MSMRVEEVAWELAPSPWSKSTSVIAAAVEVLPTIADDLEADLIEQLVLTLVEREEQLNAVIAVQSANLSCLHESEVETNRLRQLLIEARKRRQSA